MGKLFTEFCRNAAKGNWRRIGNFLRGNKTSDSDHEKDAAKLYAVAGRLNDPRDKKGWRAVRTTLLGGEQKQTKRRLRRALGSLSSWSSDSEFGGHGEAQPPLPLRTVLPHEWIPGDRAGLPTHQWEHSDASSGYSSAGRSWRRAQRKAKGKERNLRVRHNLSDPGDKVARVAQPWAVLTYSN